MHIVYSDVTSTRYLDVQEAQLLQRGRAMLRVTESLVVI